MDPNDWKALRQNYRSNDYYAANIAIDGEVVQQVGIRSRGAGSRNEEKPGLKVDFNKYVTNQEFHGYKSLVLDNLTQDQSLLRERLAYEVFERMGIPAPQNAHCRLTVNDEYWGVYGIVEAVSKPFLKARLGEESGTLFDYEYVDAYYFNWKGATGAPTSPARSSRRRTRRSSTTAPNDVHLMFRIAKTYQARKEDYEASLVYEKILSLDPDNNSGYRTESMFWKATYDGVIHRKPESLIAFIADHKDYKDIRKAYSWLAKTYQRRKEWDKAVQVYKEALNTLESDPDFYNECAWWVYQNRLTSEYNNAITCARMAVERKPDAYYIWDTLAQLYCENGEQQKAVDASSTALKLAPQHLRSTYEQYLDKIKLGKPDLD